MSYTYQNLVMAYYDCYPVNLDLSDLAGRKVLESPLFMLDQNLEVSEVCTPMVTELSQAINAGPIEVIAQAVKGDVMQLAEGSAGPIAGGVASPHAIDQVAAFSLPAAGCMADHSLVSRPAQALLVALVVTPEPLIGRVEPAVVSTATSALRDALATV